MKLKLEKKIEAKKAKALMEKEKLEKKKNKIEKKVETKKMKLDKLSDKKGIAEVSVSAKKNKDEQNPVFKTNGNSAEVSSAVTPEKMIITHDEPGLPESNQ